MPELPEVETVKNILVNNLIGKTILDVTLYREKTIEGNPLEFVNTLKDKTIVDIKRKGKFLIFVLSDDIVFLSHLRMEGKYYYFDNTSSTTKYPMVKFTFKDNTSLIYDDMRKFGTMILKNTSNYLTSEPLSKLGLEPFDFKDSDIDALYNKFHKSNHYVKELIMDQSNISGLGNIYADEVLYLSKLHPLTKGKDLDKDDVKFIISNSVITLNKAIDLGGSTIKSYHPSEGVDGLFQTRLNVYGKVGEKCPTCGETLLKIRVGGRGTTYCPRCQKNKSKPYVVGVTGKVASGKSMVTSILKDKGYHALSADDVVHSLYSDKHIQNKIIQNLNFKEFDLRKIKETIIASPDKKKWLEDFIHPLVKETMINFIYSFNKEDRVVIEIPLLFESNSEFMCDDIVFVDVSKDKQVSNLHSRGQDESYISLNSSFKEEENKNRSTIVLSNNGSIVDLRNKIDKLFK